MLFEFEILAQHFLIDMDGVWKQSEIQKKVFLRR